MENTHVRTMIENNLTKLPPKLQEAITSSDVLEKLRKLSQKYRLHLDQGQVLEIETYMVLLGIDEAEEYEKNLERELKTTSEVAKNIANDVAKEIFLSIRNVLKESTTSAPTPKLESVYEAPISTSTPSPIPATVSTPLQPTQVSTQTPTHSPITTQNKLESVVKNQSKEIKISPTKGYTVDPYREPIG